MASVETSSLLLQGPLRPDWTCWGKQKKKRKRLYGVRERITQQSFIRHCNIGIGNIYFCRGIRSILSSKFDQYWWKYNNSCNHHLNIVSLVCCMNCINSTTTCPVYTPDQDAIWIFHHPNPGDIGWHTVFLVSIILEQFQEFFFPSSQHARRKS
jgi:hypothetical protein